jgi:hypothetical protein
VGRVGFPWLGFVYCLLGGGVVGVEGVLCGVDEFYGVLELWGGLAGVWCRWWLLGGIGLRVLKEV